MTNKILYDTKYLQLKEAPSPSGHPWAYAHRPNTNPKTDNAVVIIPIIHNKANNYTLVLLETKRPPIYSEGKAETCIEFPAGLVGDETKGETIKDAVTKELLEETGYEADKITIAAKNISNSAGCTSETITMAIADITNTNILQEPVTDNGINFKLHHIKLEDIDCWLNNQSAQGKAISAQVWAGLYFVSLHLTK